MKVAVVPFGELSVDLLSRWAALQEQSAAPLDSPFYRPEFAHLINEVRGDVEVGVVELQGEVVAFLPFHRLRGNLGQPVGLLLNDFQGLIAAEGANLNAQQVLAACRLRAFDFNHVPVQQAAFAESIALTDASPFVDLSGGIDAYEKSRPTRSDSARRRRKLERERGPVRFEHDIKNRVAVETLLAWKQQQFERTGVPDILATAWVRKAVLALAESRTPAFGGVLSGLWAGDEIVAVELGLRSQHVYHVQWLAYHPEFAAYAPGRLLNESLLRWAAGAGMRRVEYGKGDQDYKVRAATGQHLVATGSVTCGALQRAVRGSWWTLRRWARSSPLRTQFKAAAGYYYRLRKAVPPLAKESL